MSRNLYPKISVNKQEWLIVDDHHQLYIEESGNPDGIPVVYLHGGPGGGSSENHRRYFDPQKYRIILFDQRGCGRSKPSPSIAYNTTEYLLRDLEKIRCHLKIDKWVVTGGSWGTTLALVYGIKYPSKVLAFILRGVFLGTNTEFDWLYNTKGAKAFFPEYYREFLDLLPEEDRQDPVLGYYKLLTGYNELQRIAASKAWFLWELRLSTIEHHNISMSQVEDSHQALCMASLSTHFFKEKCFLPDNYIMEHLNSISHLPGIILHGRYDMVCQVEHAHALSQKWQNAELQILPYAGHSGFERQTIEAFCKATDVMASFLAEK